MTDLSRGTRARRGARRPGWLLLTVLLVLAIGASSALVFTSRVELLKLAVILALWAAVVAAFVSVIYRRQSDIDQAKVRDLKLVYDLQLDREISARREYELTVETQLRRELTSEIRAQAADEVAGLRAELAALRANLEILFDADLSHRPAIETDRSRVYSDWPRDTETTGRVTASRIDSEDGEDLDANTEESPIIDVRAEPHPSEAEWVSPPSYGGAHRRPSEAEQEARAHRVEEPPRAWSPPPPQPRLNRSRSRHPSPNSTWQPPQQERARPVSRTAPPAPPARAGPPEPEPGRAGSRVAACARGGRVDTRGRTGQQLGVTRGAQFVGSADGRKRVRRRIRREETGTPSRLELIRRLSRLELIHRLSRRCRPRPPNRARPPFSATRRRRSWAPACATDIGCRIRGVPAPSASPSQRPNRRLREPEARRHRSAEDTGGQSVAELLARLQATPTGGGRRRRRDE